MPNWRKRKLSCWNASGAMSILHSTHSWVTIKDEMPVEPAIGLAPSSFRVHACVIMLAWSGNLYTCDACGGAGTPESASSPSVGCKLMWHLLVFHMNVPVVACLTV